MSKYRGMLSLTGSTGCRKGKASLGFLTCRNKALRNFCWFAGIFFDVSYVGEGSVLKRFAGGSPEVGWSWKGFDCALEGAAPVISISVLVERGGGCSDGGV